MRKKGRVYALDEDIFTNEVEYFFSLHGPRFEVMNQLMADSLRKKFGKEFRPIRIIHAWPSQHYNEPNYILLNRQAYELAKELHRTVVYIPEYEDINVEFSNDLFIKYLTKRLLAKQRTIYVFPFTTAFLDLPSPDFTILGPNAELARSFDNKIHQFNLFQELGLPHNRARIFSSVQELREKLEKIIPCYISAAYTSGGNEGGLIYSREMLEAFLAKVRPVNRMNYFIVSDIFENIVLAPNVNVLITSDEKVYVLVLTDQILQGNRYLGNIYPSAVQEDQKKQIYDMTYRVGEYLADQGYRGLFGCDFLINSSGDIVIVDLNPRHQGGYACNGLMLQEYGISLTDIELSSFSDELIDLSQSKLDKYLGFAWSHSKIIPHEAGQVVRGEYQHQAIEAPFANIGESFATVFYEAGSVFVNGYIGYQVHTAKYRELLQEAHLSMEKFDLNVGGTL